MSKKSRPTTDVDAALVLTARCCYMPQGVCLVSVCRLVQVHHANVNAVDADGKTALMYAASRGHTSLCQFLVETGGANVETADKHGWTALMHASRRGHLSVCETLVKTGRANVDAADSSQWTALTHACSSRHFSVSRCLVETGHANVEVKCCRGHTHLCIMLVSAATLALPNA
jgi:uncharacterized protein